MMKKKRNATEGEAMTPQQGVFRTPERKADKATIEEAFPELAEMFRRADREMRNPALKQKRQRQEVTRWISSAFERYAAGPDSPPTIGVPQDRVGQGRANIRLLGAEFSRIVGGTDVARVPDLPKLQDDLYHLMERDCPPLDIVELMLFCTGGFHWTSSDLLHVGLGITDEVLDQLKQSLGWITETVSRLSQVSFGPLAAANIAKRFPTNDPKEIIHKIEGLPDALRCLAALLENYPHAHEALPDTVSKDMLFAYFYLLLEHYGHGHATLSRLLWTMRHVRATLEPNAEYLRGFAPHRGGDDPFSEGALQRRLNRLGRHSPDYWTRMFIDVKRYIDDYDEHRGAGGTLLTALHQLDEDFPSWCAQHTLEAHADRVSKMQRLNDDEGAKVLRRLRNDWERAPKKVTKPSTRLLKRAASGLKQSMKTNNGVQSG